MKTEEKFADSLHDLRVIDFTGELGPYAARLYAGLGADVIHIEPMSGDPLRNRRPFYRNVPGKERSLQYLYYNAGKRGMVLDLEREQGRDVFLRLCSRADLLLESLAPGYLESLDLGYDTLCSANPALVQTSMTPFGHSGPYRDHPGSDLVCSALGGFLFLAGVENEKPVRACDNQSFRMAEAYAAVSSAVALFHARRTGAGQFVDVSCVEAVATALENAPQYYDLEGVNRRGRGKEAGGGTIHPCRDGYVVLVAVMGRNHAMWDAFVQWMRDEDVEEWDAFQDPRWVDPSYRSTEEAYELFCRVFEKYTLKHDKLYLYQTGQAHRVAVSPVSNGKDLLENPQLDHHRFWETLWHENLEGEITYPGAPYAFSRLRWRLGSPAPAFGRHTFEILLELGYTGQEIRAMAREGVIHAARQPAEKGPSHPPEIFDPGSKKAPQTGFPQRPAAKNRALEGLVVCDFAWVGAGPIATSLLAQCGAKVIKIESRKRPDVLRLTGPFKDGISQGLERSGYFASRNPNKQSISLDMNLPEAREVARRLIRKSDIVINNFRVGQMEKWKLGWEDVRKINPRIVYVTMSLQGTTGPHRSFMGFGVNLNGLCGLTARSAFPGQTPFGTGTHYTDHVMVPAHTLFGIMAALMQRGKTGEGQAVAVSQLEASISMKPLDAMAYAANGDIPGPLGFSDPDAAPHGVFHTLNSREWIAIAVFNEKEWEALKRVMDNPSWAEDAKFDSLEARKENERELNAHVEAWSHRQEAKAVMKKLVSNGVRAGVVHDAKGVIEDEHLTGRGFWVNLDHPEAGVTLYNRAPFLMSGTPVEMQTAAPLLGQHTREVLTGMLGYTEEEVEALAHRGVLA